MKLKVIPTKDGSNTLFHEQLNETYHSSHGALTESKYVFIQEGFDYLRENKKSIRILEIGFGTGLNAVLTVEKALQHQLSTTYVSLEPFPLSQEVIEELKYRELLIPESQPLFEVLHQAVWDQQVEMNPYFHLWKLQTTLADFQPVGEGFDLVYYDAFAPSKQPEMWSVESLQKTYDVMADGGVLVTYCANGQFKRNLKACGFEVTNIPGPPGKREMTRAFKK